MWIKFYNFNFGETSNAYIPTYKSFKSCQFSTFLNSLWKISIVWKLLDLGVKGFCVGMKIKGGARVLSRSNGKFKARTQTLPICPNLSETHHRSICFHKLITVDPTRCSFTFTSTANEWHQLNRLPNHLDFYKTALRQTLVLKHFPFSRSIARKSHIIDYISVQIYQNIFVLVSLLNIDYAENSFLFYDPARCYKNVPVVNSNFCHKVPHLCHNFH